MKKSICVVFFLLLVGLFSGGLWAEGEDDSQFVSKTDTALINWTEGLLKAVGRGTPPKDYYGEDKGREVALASAIENAREKLMEVIGQIPIDAERTVGELIQNNASVLAELEEMVDMAEVVHQEFTTDGSVSVTVQMSMNGGFSQLVLPQVIKQIESVKPISASSDSPSEDGGGDVSETIDVVSGPYTGMIVDGRGIGVTPCMAPRVYDENGREVFGPAYASREFAVQHGMSVYVSDMEAAARHPRVADRPLILTGLRAGGAGGNDIIVSNTDAARLRSASTNLALLRQCRVMIVVDAPDASRKG